MRVTQFWLLSRNVDRIAAEEDQRAAQVAAAVQSGEGWEAFVRDRQRQMGKVVVLDETAPRPEPVAPKVEEYDREGLLSLKGLGRLTG